MSDNFQETVEKYVNRARYSAGQLAALTGLPKRTIANWLMGRVTSPRHWQDVVGLAAALRLPASEADELLQAAGHKQLTALYRLAANEAERALFAPWPQLSPAPFQAIPDLPYFVGRETAVATLTEALQDENQVRQYSLRGMGGVGKTALAAHLAYQVRDAFPDGVLWARLDASDTMSILAAFAAVYGEDVTPYQDIASRAAVVRALLADRRVLVVLDNAETSEQVRPLLPPTTGKTAVIVTTRQALAVTDTMRSFVIEPFAAQGEESLALFSRFIEKTAVQRYEPELRQIAALLGHLPLALVIAAGQLSTWFAIPDYLARLQSEEKQLDSLVREDRSVRLSFDLSFQALRPALQTFLIDLGAFAGADFSVAAAAVVTQTPEEIALQHLLDLARGSLVQMTPNRRFTLHPLLQTYAREKQPDNNSRQRMTRFFLEYLQSCADDFSALAQEISNVHAALDAALTLKMEGAYVTAVLTLGPIWQAQGAAANALPYLQTTLGLPDDVVGLTRAPLLTQLGRCQWQTGQTAEARQSLEQALALAYRQEEDDLISQLLLNLGVIAGYNDANYSQAIAYFEQALPYARAAGKAERLGLLLSNMANVFYEQGDWPQAATYWQESATVFVESGQTDTVSYVRLIHNLGVMALDMGEPERAQAYLEEGLQIAEAQRFREMLGTISATLGRLATEKGQYPQAEMWLTEALAIARELALSENICLALGHWAMAAIGQRQFGAAAAYLAEARTVAEEAQIAWLQVDVLLKTGELHWRQGQIQEAQTAFAIALEQAKALHMLELEALALWGLARVAAERGDMEKKEAYGREALCLFSKMGHTRAKELV